MKKQSEKFDSILKKVVQHMVDAELYGWPPQCTAFLYQPVRPQKAVKKLSESKKEPHE